MDNDEKWTDPVDDQNYGEVMDDLHDDIGGLDIDKPNVRAFIYIMGLLIAAVYAGIGYGLYKLVMWIWSLLPL